MVKRVCSLSSPPGRLLRGLTIFFLLGCSALVFGAQTADPNAMSDAKKILNYYYTLPAKTDTKVIAGQFGQWGNSLAAGYQAGVVALQASSGKWVSLMGTDWHDFNSGKAFVPAPLISWWNAGGLVTVDYHIDNPYGGGAWSTGANLAGILTAGSAANKTWLSELDWTASNLQTLQSSGVIVIWRPFHEMNGGWFWWGNGDVASFVALWKHMFNYFTTTKGLHNLLWLYAPNTGGNMTKYYPGDAYVDLVGIDGYFNVPSTINITSDYNSMLTLNKPLGFSEFGGIPAAGGSQNVFDNMVLINSIRASYPKMCFFQNWHCAWAIDCQKNSTQLMNDPWVLTREKLAWKNSTPVEFDSPIRNTPQVLPRNNSTQTLYTLQGRAIKYAGKGTVPSGLYFRKTVDGGAPGQTMGKIIIGNDKL
jgi:mannan endo-1,4-beta-mannosidase